MGTRRRAVVAHSISCARSSSRVLQVSLDDDAGMQLLEAGLGEELTEEPVGQVLRVVALHVEPDLGAPLGCRREDREEALPLGRKAGIDSERSKVRREGRRLDRGRHPRQPPEVIGLEPLVGGPALARAEERLEEAGQPGCVPVRLGVGERVLAEEVDRGSSAPTPHLSHLAGDLAGILADDELLGHPADLAPRDARGDPAPARHHPGQLDRPADELGRRSLVEVLDEVLDRVPVVPHRREDVDEPEELGLELREAHRE